MSSRHINQMWLEACELLSEAERLQKQFFRPNNTGRTPVWEPPIDLLETHDGLFITVALPGVAPEGVEVSLHGGNLVVSGVRPLPMRAQGGRIHRLEMPYGRFERRIPLPAGHYELVAHGLVHGCLQLNLKKLR